MGRNREMDPTGSISWYQVDIRDQVGFVVRAATEGLARQHTTVWCEANPKVGLGPISAFDIAIEPVQPEEAALYEATTGIAEDVRLIADHRSLPIPPVIHPEPKYRNSGIQPRAH